MSDTDRRAFLRGAGVAVGSFVAGGFGALMIQDTYNSAKSTLFPKRRDATFDTEIEAIKEMSSLPYFVPITRDVVISGGNWHYAYGNAVPASVSDASDPFRIAFGNLFETVTLSEELLTHDHEADVVSFGSPSSNAFWAVETDYLADGLGHGRILSISESPRHNLPFRMVLDGAFGRSVRRWSSDRAYEEPEWRIQLRDGRFLTPRVNGNRNLLEDYLVITKVRNTRSPSNFILNFAGLHGPGMAAVRLVLRRQRVFDAVLDGLSNIDAMPWDEWQCLVPVAAVELRNGRDIPVDIDVDGILVERVYRNT